MTFQALYDRFSNCGDWLEAIALSLLRQAAPQVSGAFRGQRLLVVDTTSVCSPGAASASFRLHLRFDLSGGIEGIDMSDGAGAERLSRFSWAEGGIALADRGLAKAPELDKLVAAGASFILRSGWNAFKWLDNHGAPLNLTELLDAAADGVREHGVRIAVKLKGEAERSVPLRLILLRLPEDKAREARKRARKTARKNGKSIDPRTLAAAGFTMIVTNLPGSFSCADISAVYRLRWQIELLFKRLKSLAGLGQLPARKPGLAKAWIFAKLIIAILAETAAQKLADSPPSGASRALSRKAGLGHRPLLPRPHHKRNPRPASAHAIPAPKTPA